MLRRTEAIARMLAASTMAWIPAGPTLADAPMGYLAGHGSKAYPVVALTWGTLIISIVVVAIFVIAVPLGVWRRAAGSGREAMSATPPMRGGRGLSWITIGLVLTSVALLVTLVWTMTTLAAVNGPGGAPPLTIEITGYQWWWKARYLSEHPEQVFTTANEIHIPTGQPVRLKIITGDVVHSFYVPALAGRMDAIPGQVNETWLEADQPGRYRGQCTEFCGLQHAHMGVYVVADRPADFVRWRQAQLQPAAAALTPEAVQGEQAVVYRCGVCHTVRGTNAGGSVAPDLTHLMSRQTIAAATLPNTAAGLSGWIGDPQAVKPGNHMPTFYLSGPELKQVRSYLETLK